jgi:hypothetical protein
LQHSSLPISDFEVRNLGGDLNPYKTSVHNKKVQDMQRLGPQAPQQFFPATIFSPCKIEVGD